MGIGELVVLVRGMEVVGRFRGLWRRERLGIGVERTEAAVRRGIRGICVGVLLAMSVIYRFREACTRLWWSALIVSVRGSRLKLLRGTRTNLVKGH